MNAITKPGLPSKSSSSDREYLSFTVGGQLFGIPVLTVQDVLNARTLARIPLAPKEVAGSLNLRGRIVTAIDMRRRMDIRAAAASRGMNIVVDHNGELYSLVVDAVGDVLRLTGDTFEANPATLNPSWKDLSLGVHRLQVSLLIVLDVDRLLTL